MGGNCLKCLEMVGNCWKCLVIGDNGRTRREMTKNGLELQELDGDG